MVTSCGMISVIELPSSSTAVTLEYFGFLLSDFMASSERRPLQAVGL
jgi:hypothetical protein